MTSIKHRIAALVLATLLATAGAIAASAAVTDEAHAVGQTGNSQNQLDA
jgi:hypothetical protein